MKRATRWLFIVLALALSGCATQNVSHAPGSDIASIKTIYVQKLPADQRGIDQLFVKQLNEWGYQASSGSAERPTTPVDAVLTYQDRWAWDITMYMIRLNVQLRDTKNDTIVASAESMRPSLERLSPPEMVKEVLQALLKRPK